MSIFQALVLGIIQGLTEFLPVSSSGHLVIAQHLIGIPNNISFDLVVHLATVLAVIIYFARDIWELIVAFILGTLEAFKIKRSQNYVFGQHFRVGWLIIIASIPTALMGFFFKDFFEALFNSNLAVGGFLLVTAAVILLAEWRGKNNRDEFQVGFLDAIIIGVAQGCAIAPGLSRSGATVSAALWRGLKRDFAARFSFLLAIPAILGAGIFKFGDVSSDIAGGVIGVWPLLAGAIAALVSGLFAIKIFMEIIRRTSIRCFAYYCIVLGIVVIVCFR
ncbi:MAG: undecaprenyl-diphosphate phosphatase [Candidatus Margulisbacteria bacterium]|nr:undecaprenyl-diphosphate phosphatase [Candidatus Margulisiibacteriota bacterium]MBU1022626.1 undecaprenyl-diphosphate phosphatase [Candidatus Margulisiibacteriota bacterium]MBU1729437.1 undecaprenyl-diphosphate phosphatase [Candidatus Margulisiibacteriota bacterium]MBU1955462.1 undecaprenyl-diphosphate phosphatase [Candidatus Margulisiibacteriota bacterium]